MRFNDTLKLDLSNCGLRRGGKPSGAVSKVVLAENSPIPLARTYHASCLIKNYMVVVGGEASSDLKDFWALDLDTFTWFKPEVEQFENFTAKRFHSATALNETQVVTFGGCHSEYIHMNEMHIFELSHFLQSPTDKEVRIICTRVNVELGVPSTRWGHSAAAYDG